jgi:hypothetical protein
MISTAVVGFADGHRVVGEVDIAVVTWKHSVLGSDIERLDMRGIESPTEECIVVSKVRLRWRRGVAYI